MKTNGIFRKMIIGSDDFKQCLFLLARGGPGMLLTNRSKCYIRMKKT